MSQNDEAISGQLKESLVVGRTIQEVELSGKLLKLSRLAAVFELYNPPTVLRLSEVLKDFSIKVGERTLYSGKAVVRGLINTGPAVVVCEATLSESSWMDVSLAATNGQLGKRLDAEYRQFLREWQKLYKIHPDYKLVLADMQTYFADLRLWLDQLELGARGGVMTGRSDLELEIAAKLAPAIKANMTTLFEKFEDTIRTVDPELEAAHQLYARRQLHPLLLCSPFLNRCYVKPLGYAGDYEMVNMMLRSPFEGDSLFAKIINYWFVQQAPAEAHRHRIEYLVRQLIRVATRAASEKRRARILSVACGPAQEVQRFVADHEISSNVDVSLLDFNEETLKNTGALMTGIAKRHHRNTQFHYIKKSVHRIIKESGRTATEFTDAHYDFVYCAGLFDYLSNQVCQHLMNAMYEWLAPGGLLVSTNVDSSNPRRLTMDYIMAWHLIYRNGAELAALKPEAAAAENCKVIADLTGVNVYLETVKPGE